MACMMGREVEAKVGAASRVGECGVLRAGVVEVATAGAVVVPRAREDEPSAMRGDERTQGL